MKTGKLIQRVQSLYSKGVESHDSRLSRRHIYNKLLTVRGLLMFQKLNKNQHISQWSYQTLPCVELELVPAHECPCLPPVGCTILRSRYTLPEPVNSISKHLFQSITSIEASMSFGETSWKAKKWRSGDKYTSKKPDFLIHDDYLYLTVTKAIKVVSVVGLFNDPVEAENFPSFCDASIESVPCPGSPLEVEFPIDSSMLEPLIEISVKELVFAFSQMKEDITNDARDNTGMIPRQYPRRYPINEERKR